MPNQSLHRNSLLFALAAVLALLAVSCGGGDEGAETATPAGENAAEEEPALEPRDVTMVMNWFPQSEQGGYWQVEAENIGADQGVTIDVIPGGPQIQTVAQVASGQFDYGIAQADEVLLARNEGVPVVYLLAPLDTTPQCFMFQPAANIDSFEDIEGHPVAVAPSGGYWPYIKNEFELDEVREINFTGQLAELKQNDQLVQQCFFTSEPFVAEQEGIPFETLLIADSGYNPYANGLFTTEKKIQEDPEEVATVVAAAKEGWETFMADPTAGIEHIVEVNEEMTEDKARFAHGQMAEHLIEEPIGCMDPERWDTLISQLQQVDLLPGDADASGAFTNEFATGCE
jgi:NitT/TauT family transport system substrate-binding protein